MSDFYVLGVVLSNRFFVDSPTTDFGGFATAISCVCYWWKGDQNVGSGEHLLEDIGVAVVKGGSGISYSWVLECISDLHIAFSMTVSVCVAATQAGETRACPSIFPSIVLN